MLLAVPISKHNDNAPHQTKRSKSLQRKEALGRKRSKTPQAEIKERSKSPQRTEEQRRASYTNLHAQKTEQCDSVHTHRELSSYYKLRAIKRNMTKLHVPQGQNKPSQKNKQRSERTQTSRKAPRVSLPSEETNPAKKGNRGASARAKVTENPPTSVFQARNARGHLWRASIDLVGQLHCRIVVVVLTELVIDVHEAPLHFLKRLDLVL